MVIDKRKAGVLLPIFSLPGEYGIGTLGTQAYGFVDKLKAARQGYWQVLPQGPTSYGDSPYQSFSTFAGNPYFIDLTRLVEQGLLMKWECDEAYFGNEENYIDYKALYDARFVLLKKAFDRSDRAGDEKYIKFKAENSFWLEDY
ncbi:MAG: 4-alpha-glucanotransferase, partial [Oscillospiraceae bacterium]